MKKILYKRKKLSKAELVYLKQQELNKRRDEHGGIFNVVQNAAVRYQSNPELVNKEQGLSSSA
jgi:hypothetical protein